jgi:hypothetical protein
MHAVAALTVVVSMTAQTRQLLESGPVHAEAESRGRWTERGALLANALVLTAVVLAALLHASDPDLYYRAVQEDEALEWATFWSFLTAAAAFGVSVRRRAAFGGRPWFLLVVSLFCLFVAMEEVSWGQRVVGYRPPAYFLEHNFQQELNLHNVVATKYRKLALAAVIGGYGIALPLLFLLPATARLLRRLGAAAPPLGLVPAFLATLVAYLWYPWTHTGEWVEFMLGLGFLFAAMLRAELPSRMWPSSRPAWSSAVAVALSGLAVLGLGLLTAALSRIQRSDHPETVAAAKAETEALRRDFAGGRLHSRCGLHKRLYTYAEKYREAELLQGEFGALVAQGLPEARARYLLDPWNSPYWIRDSCSTERSRRSVFVYSFGPDRRRDSTAWQILGDDIGTFIRQEGGGFGAARQPHEEAETDDPQ